MLLTLAVMLVVAPAVTETCSPTSRAAGLCNTSVGRTDNAIEIIGERRDSRHSDNGGEGRSGRGVDERAGAEEEFECHDALNRCGMYEFEIVTRPDATLTDVASFAPSIAPVDPEPAGIGVAGLPLNVVASASEHTRAGELFDLPVTVRFRPVSFTFHYGDGASRESTTGGQTWTRLGLPQFSPTATSHTYRHPGTYTVSATVHLSADVDFGTGWIPVEGLLAVPAGSTTVEIVEAHTALVAHTCGEVPSGIGC